jgi:hypothetical protein
MRAISNQARDAIRVLQLVIDTEEISVPDAAKHLNKTPQWVRENLPVIYHSRKSHSVRLKDLADYQAKRIVWPGRRH